ncbi:DUF4019 domain-containing protein [Paraburkholderia caledonica]
MKRRIDFAIASCFARQASSERVNGGLLNGVPTLVIFGRACAFVTRVVHLVAVVLSLHSSVSQAVSATPETGAEQQPTYLYFLTQDSRLEAERMAKAYACAIDATQGDPGKLSAFYREAMQSDVVPFSERRFIESVEKTRVNFNAPSDRVLESVDGGFRQLPGYPNGQYAIVSFDLRFPGSPLIYTEQLTLSREPIAAHWRLVAYFIGSKPFYLYQ